MQNEHNQCVNLVGGTHYDPAKAAVLKLVVGPVVSLLIVTASSVCEGDSSGENLRSRHFLQRHTAS